MNFGQMCATSKSEEGPFEVKVQNYYQFMYLMSLKTFEF